MLIYNLPDEFDEEIETDPVENLIHQARQGNDEYRKIKYVQVLGHFIFILFYCVYN